MKRFNPPLAGLTACAAFALAAPAHAGDLGDIAKGAAIGAAGGAAVGAIVPGISTTDGLLVGAAGGAVVGALDKDGRRWYRDDQGRRYYVDKRGRRHYRR
jgi:hypothetical protein